MMNIHKLCLLTLSALTLSMGVAAAQGRILGLVEGNADPRSAAMGNTALGLSESFQLYNNPAALVYGSKALSVSASGDFSLPSTSFGTPMQYALTAGFKLGEKRAIYVGGRYNGGLSIPVSHDTTIDGTGSSTILKPYEWSVDLGYAFTLSPGIVIHGTGSYAQSDLGRKAGGLLFSVGASYATGIDLGTTPSFLQVGLRLMDAGTSVKFDNTGVTYALPTSVALGGEWEFALTEDHHLSWALSSRYFTPKEATLFLAGTGLEYNWRDMLKVRGGFQYGQHDLSKATVGLGAQWNGFHLDAAYSVGLSRTALNNLTVGLGYTF